MESTPAKVPAPPFVQTWLPLVLFGLLWIDLGRQLSYTWETNEQYAYGWFVPLLMLGLLFRRWTTRPVPQSQPLSFWLTMILILIAACFLPLRVIHEVNPDWPLISWALVVCLTATCLFAVYTIGGLGWIRHFAFPICFMLVAVRWPYRIEHSLTQSLMQVVAALTVEIIGWFGIPAVQQGNLIEVSSGVLGVDEACSGIRSFQSTLMAALFLGELYLLRPHIRVLLIAAGLLAAFFLNLCRTLLLTWQANAHGLSIIDKWHDPAGFTIAIACFAVLWLIAALINRVWPARPVTASVDTPRSSVLMPRFLVWGLACWVGLVLIGNEVWFRFHEIKRRSRVDWTLSFPTHLQSYRTVTLPKDVLGALKADSNAAAEWQTDDGGRWLTFYFRWRSGSMLSLVQARAHRPEVCLPAAGRTLEQEAGVRVFPVHGADISFQSYVFNQRGEPLFVFFCLWEDGGENLPRTDKLRLKDRLQASLSAQRRAGQRTLEFIVSGYATLEAAEAALRAQLPELLKFNNEPVADQSAAAGL